MNILGMRGPADLIFFGSFAIVLGAVVLFLVRVHRNAMRFGYPSTAAYLRAAPRTDEERRDAADLALKGLVFCLLGVIFTPFILAGLIPLFYGARKLAYASLGLGLVDDGDVPRA